MLENSEVPANGGRVVEVVSDVVCPWCFIGKRRIQKALQLLGRPGIGLRWKPFQLNPGAPKEGWGRQAYRARKFGSADYAKQLEARVAAAGAGEGIDFQFDRIQLVPNTFQAHRLIWLADREGVQDAVVEKLFHSYFVAAENIGERDVLRRIGAESGISADSLDGLFSSDVGSDEVRSEELHARRLGVNGVPSFFVAGEPVAEGADAPENLAAALGPALAQCSVEGGVCG